MDKFVKPHKETMESKEYIKNLLNIQLEKDLCEDEEICKYCRGTGIVAVDNLYGLENDPDDNGLGFPYSHKSLKPCPHCFNGVVHRCKYCGKIIDGGYRICYCKGKREHDEKVFYDYCQKQMDKMPLATSEIIENTECFYSDEFGFFHEWNSFFDYWRRNHTSEDRKPKYVRTTVPTKFKLDGRDFVESEAEEFCEDSFDNIDESKLNELQNYLDKWCEECGIGITYSLGNYKIEIPWEKYDE